MDDFLHNLRTGKDKRYDRSRRDYNSPQYRSVDRQNNMDRRKKGGYRPQSSEQAYQSIIKILPGVKTLLESMAEAQTQQMQLEKRKALALETIAVCLKKMNGLEDIADADALSAKEEPLEQTSSLESVDGDSSSPESEDRVSIIRRLRDNGLSFEKIAQQLDADGVPTPSGRGKWRGQTVSKLLKE